MNFAPMHDRILVKRKEAETRTKTGFILQPTADDKPDQGTVIAVGTGKVLPDGTVRPMAVAKDDEIIFAKGAGSLVKIDDEEFIVMKEEEVFAVIED
jgi:chaperonin GroES